MRIVLLLWFALPLLSAQPEAEISNGSLVAKLYLPDPQKGYYRGTRFDWSGQIASLRFGKHEYFGQWFERYDPTLHDAIMGPVEEFRTNGAGLGFDEAKAGQTFIRIGVGVVRRPDGAPYQSFRTYEIVDAGRWGIKNGKDWIEFRHDLTGPNGYAYRYTKRIRLAKAAAGMTIEHTLENRGKRRIETAQYNHNFFVIDGQPSGPDTVVRFPFTLEPVRAFPAALAETRGGEVIYKSELQKGQSMIGEFKGFGATAADYDIRVENKKAGAGVRIRGDRPLSKVVYWSIRSTTCPEPYIDLAVEPRQKTRWKYDYTFYELGGK